MFSNEELIEIKVFLALLFPWDEEGSQLYKSVSWTFTNKKGEGGVANYATQSLDNLVRLITSRTTRAGANVYVCLGTQRMASVETYSSDGFPKAIRQHSNIVSYKSIALDIDVGKKDSYATTDDAFAALDDFCRVSGMPRPTMEVQSGSGGLHVYWCFKDPVPYANWVPLSKGLQAAALNYGLKFDPQVTVNPAGILRVPNTLNHKKAPPSKVFLYEQSGPDKFPRYGYQQIAGILGPNARAGAAGTVPPGSRSNKTRSDAFGAGVESMPPVDIKELAINCGVIDDILEREGDGDKEPLWNLAVYAASFTSDPHDAAHALSRGHAGYTFDSTEKKLHEKINARASNQQAGWPTCESFSQHHAACATCPLFAAKKTPFHHVPVYKSTSQNTAQQFVPSGNDGIMPDGYWRNKLGHVYTLLYDKQGNPNSVQIVGYPILDGGIDRDTGSLLFETVIGGTQRQREINVSANMQPIAMAGALSKGDGLHLNAKVHNAARDFFVAWLAHLQTLKQYRTQGSYGWQAGNCFAFDDRVFYHDRTVTVFRGRNTDPSFTSAGELKPWQDAMQLIYGNHPLEAMVASAFAAPLVSMLGHSSPVLSIYSSKSGVGKTTALTIAQSVWGHPRSGMSILSDTLNSTMKKIGDLKSLPVYWDELRTKDQLEKVIDLVFQVTQGKAKARLSRESTQMEAKTFTTMFAVASNYGIADTVYRQTESTQAGGLRVFEIEAGKLIGDASSADARHLLLPLEENYGIAGPLYAEYLVKNRAAVMAMVKKLDKELGEHLALSADERFWHVAVVTLLAGASLANVVGLTRFNMPTLRDYVIGQLGQQRGNMSVQGFATMQDSQDVLALIRELMHETRNKHMIMTETIPYGVLGKPLPNNLVDTDMSRVQNVWLQVGDKDGRIRLQARAFHEWLHKRHLSPKQIIEGLRKHYFVNQSKQTIGAGVPGLDALAKVGRFACYDLTPLPSASSPSPDSDEPS